MISVLLRCGKFENRIDEEFKIETVGRGRDISLQIRPLQSDMPLRDFELLGKSFALPERASEGLEVRFSTEIGFEASDEIEGLGLGMSDSLFVVANMFRTVARTFEWLADEGLNWTIDRCEEDAASWADGCVGFEGIAVDKTIGALERFNAVLSKLVLSVAPITADPVGVG